MKRLFWSFAILAGVAFVASCNNGDYSANPTSGYNNVPNTLNSSIPVLQAGIGHYYYFKTNIVTAKDSANVLIIRGTASYPDTNQTTLSVYIANFNGVGTYDMYSIYDTTKHSTARFNTSSDTSGAALTGQIYVSTVGKRLQGSFFFHTIDTSVTVNSGYFDVPNPLQN